MRQPTRADVGRALKGLAELFPAVEAENLDEIEAIRHRLQLHVYGKYEVAIINAIPREFAAVQAVFGPPQKLPIGRDGRTSLDVVTIRKESGREQPIIVAGVAGQGLVQTAVATAAVAHQLPFLRTVILVGIAAGQPVPTDEERDVWLGDIVVGEAVVQYDHVKRQGPDDITCRGTRLPIPSPSLLAVARAAKAEMELTTADPWSWEAEINAAVVSWPKAARPRLGADTGRKARTYRAPTMHRHAADRPHLHTGVIGSANTLLKDAAYRDRLHAEFKTIAYEMEGAGLAISAPIFGAQYLIVRGICDYGDDRKNDTWQHYAAVEAAAFAKVLLAKV